MTDPATTLIREWAGKHEEAVLIEDVSLRPLNPPPHNELCHAVLVGREVLLFEIADNIPVGSYVVSGAGTLGWRETVDFDTHPEQFEAEPLPVEMNGSRTLFDWMKYLPEDALLSGFVCLTANDSEVWRNLNWYTMPFRVVEPNRLIELLDLKWDAMKAYGHTLEDTHPTLLAAINKKQSVAD